MSDEERLSVQRGAAYAVAALVHAVSHENKAVRERFLDNLSVAYIDLKENRETSQTPALETLSWIRSLVTGFDHATGQGEPFFNDPK